MNIPEHGGHPGSVSQRRRWLFIGMVMLVLIAVAVTGGLSYYVGSNLIHPQRKPITNTPDAYALVYKTIRFPSAVDQLQLSGWLIPATGETNKLVIEAHGYGQNRSSDAPALPVAKALHEAGIAVLLFDFRGEGESSGNKVSVGLYEQRDLRGAIAYARRLGYRHIGVIGYSMGAATALEVASADQGVEATIADSPFANLYDYLSRHFSVWTHLPNWPFTPEILFELRVFDHLNAHRVDPERDAAKLGQAPVLLIAGTADKTIPMSNSLALYRALRHDRSASLWIVPGAKHVGAYRVEPQRYLERVVGFFDQCL
ncbi:alpha/beta hydrolase [Thiorhodovibrio winogradskyi]|nr:alpha/beta hydrolase [Thiorhodovibrio winogradskyi]